MSAALAALIHLEHKSHSSLAAQKQLDNRLLCDTYPSLREEESVKGGMKKKIQKLVDEGALTYNKEAVNDPSTLKVRVSDFSEYDDRDIIFKEFGVFSPETYRERTGHEKMSAKRRKFVNDPLNQTVIIEWTVPEHEKDKNEYSLRAKMTMGDFVHQRNAVLSGKTSLDRMIARFSGCLDLAPKRSWQHFFNEAVE